MDLETRLREKLLSDFSTNFMVEAGAGAGKTTLIIDRILNQITIPGSSGEPMKLEDIAAITFTEKAANELKLRVALGIEKRLQETSDLQAKKLLQAAKISIDDQFVGTIHSFCQEILRKNSFEAGLGLDYKVIDPDEDVEIKELVWQRHLIKEEISLVPLMKRLDQLDLSIADAKSAFDTITRHEYSIIDFDSDTYTRESPIENLHESMRPLAAFFRIGPDGELETKYGEPLKKALNDSERKAFEPYFRQPTAKGVIVLANTLIAKDRKDGVICSKPYAKTSFGNELLCAIDMQSIKRLYEEYNIYKYDVIMSIAYPAIGEYTRYKRSIMAVNFDDLLVLSRNLLRDSKEARRRTGNRYKCLYIDEYQDTDSIQSEIMFYLNGETHDDSSAWYTRRLIPGSTFIVGDPKQSIYRFRGADITQYNRVKDIFEDDPNCEIVVLKRNYRTQSGIIDWVEKAFKLPEGCENELEESANGSQKFLLDQRAPYQASFFGMDAQRIDTESDEVEVIKGVYYFVAGDEKRIDDYRNSESIWVSGYIDRLVKEGFLIETHNIASGALERRPVRYGDFLILLYYTKGMGDYITSLKEKNIPVSYAGRLKLGNIDEIANYIDLVQYLANPRNESMLCNVLINCFGINDLEAWKKNVEERINLVDYLEKNETQHRSEPVFYALSILKDLIALKYSMTPIAFMKRLLDEFSIIYTNRYNETLLKSIAGTLHYLLEKLSAKSLVSFEIAARELNLMKDMDTDREMLLEDSGANGGSGYVRIMNLHKAKGLEAPIVILATGGKEYSHSACSATRQTDRGREVYLKLLRGNSTIGYSSAWSSIEEEEARSLRAEALRLHYVAATRPINALVVSGRKDNNWKRYQGLLFREIPRDFPADYTESGDLFWLDKKFVKIKKNELIDRRKVLVDKVSIAQYTEIKPSMLEEIIEITWSEASSRIDYEGPSGELWGTTVHRMLELYFISCGNVLADTSEIDAANAIIDRAIEESKKDADFSPYRDQLYQILKSFTLNPEVRRITAAARLLPELRFDLIREGEEVKEYISGIIDLLISADKGVYLMDYKTNVPRGNMDEFINQMKETYKPQLGLYREFLENTMGKKVLGAFLYLTVLDQVIEVV